MEQSFRNINIYPELTSISKKYQALLLDAYGVFWNGNSVGFFPGSKEIMEQLVAEGKCIGILSNATQQPEKEILKLKAHGLIEGKHFHFFITSGSVSRTLFLNNTLPFPTPNKKFYMLGEESPKSTSYEAIFQDTLFEKTTHLEEADFLYIGIPNINGEDQRDPLVFKEYVDRFKEITLPIVCPNPDRFAHEGNPPKAMVRQGSIAMMCEEWGGRVFYIGKPSKIMYATAMNYFTHYGISDPREVLMVGDTPETDIRGARQFGMDGALVIKTGIFAERVKAEGFEKSCTLLPPHDLPDFFIEYMCAKR